MFRKIRSNRGPADTIANELCKLFGKQLLRVQEKMAAALNHRPRLILAVMLFLRMGSAVCSFIIWPHPRVETKRPENRKNSRAAAGNTGFDRLLSTAAAIQETLALRARIDSLVNKGNLSATDSLALGRSLDRLQHLHQNIQP